MENETKSLDVAGAPTTFGNCQAFMKSMAVFVVAMLLLTNIASQRDLLVNAGKSEPVQIEISIAEMLIIEGDRINITAKIKNNEAVDAEANVSFYYDEKISDKLIATKSVLLKSFASTNVTVLWNTVNLAGNHTVYVVVETQGKSYESSKNLRVRTISEAIDYLNEEIQRLPDNVFKKPAANRKTAFSNKLEAVKKQFEAGAYNGMIDKLLDDIRAKVDGEKENGEDWVIEESAQNKLMYIIDKIVYSDVDADGLTFYEEIKVYGTDGFNADTDGDGLPDGYEVRSGMDPLDATNMVHTVLFAPENATKIYFDALPELGFFLIVLGVNGSVPAGLTDGYGNPLLVEGLNQIVVPTEMMYNIQNSSSLSIFPASANWYNYTQRNVTLITFSLSGNEAYNFVLELKKFGYRAYGMREIHNLSLPQAFFDFMLYIGFGNISHSPDIWGALVGIGEALVGGVIGCVNTLVEGAQVVANTFEEWCNLVWQYGWSMIADWSGFMSNLGDFLLDLGYSLVTADLPTWLVTEVFTPFIDAIWARISEMLASPINLLKSTINSKIDGWKNNVMSKVFSLSGNGARSAIENATLGITSEVQNYFEPLSNALTWISTFVTPYLAMLGGMSAVTAFISPYILELVSQFLPMDAEIRTLLSNAMQGEVDPEIREAISQLGIDLNSVEGFIHTTTSLCFNISHLDPNVQMQVLVEGPFASPTDTSAVITWTTSIASNGTVYYGLDTNYGFSATDSNYRYQHSVILTGLSPSTTYHYQVKSVSDTGIQVVISGDYTFTTKAMADTTPPKIIKGPVVSAITSNSATITWITDEASDSVVEYGTNTSYGKIESDSAYVTNHSITLKGLTSNTTYHFRVKSTDLSGNTVVSEDYNFTTLIQKKFALLLGEGGQGADAAVKRDLGELETLLRSHGFEIIGDHYHFGLNFTEIDWQIKALGQVLNNSGTNDNIVFVVFCGHGSSENHDAWVLSDGSAYNWSAFAHMLSSSTIIDADGDNIIEPHDTPKYSKMIIVIQACFAENAEDDFRKYSPWLPDTNESNDPNRIVITSCRGDQESYILPTIPLVGDHIIFLGHFTNKLQGDWWGAFGMGFVCGSIWCMVPATILGGIIAIILSSCVPLLIAIIVGALIPALVAAIGAVMEPRSIYDAFTYADAWTNWGIGFWKLRISDPCLYNENLAKSTFL